MWCSDRGVESHPAENFDLVISAVKFTQVKRFRRKSMRLPSRVEPASLSDHTQAANTVINTAHK